MLHTVVFLTSICWLLLLLLFIVCLFCFFRKHFLKFPIDYFFVLLIFLKYLPGISPKHKNQVGVANNCKMEQLFTNWSHTIYI